MLAGVEIRDRQPGDVGADVPPLLRIMLVLNTVPSRMPKRSESGIARLRRSRCGCCWSAIQAWRTCATRSSLMTIILLAPLSSGIMPASQPADFRRGAAALEYQSVVVLLGQSVSATGSLGPTSARAPFYSRKRSTQSSADTDLQSVMRPSRIISSASAKGTLKHSRNSPRSSLRSFCVRPRAR